MWRRTCLPSIDVGMSAAGNEAGPSPLEAGSEKLVYASVDSAPLQLVGDQLTNQASCAVWRQIADWTGGSANTLQAFQQAILEVTEAELTQTLDGNNDVGAP